MLSLNGESISGNPDIGIYDICGLWEVIRIFKGSMVTYPWLKDRFKYSFQPEMIYICLLNGESSHGTWKLSEEICEDGKRYAIILNDNYSYTILGISEDELTLADDKNSYHLVRRL
jgi:hypothetical protein